MWGDWERPGAGKYWAAKPYLRFDEKLWNELQAELEFSLLCAYPSHSVSGHEHMDALSRRYLKVDRYPWALPGERGAIFRIEATRVYHEAGDADIPING